MSWNLSLPRKPPPPWKWKTLIFFPEFKSELTQNTPPWKWKALTFFPEFKSELTQNTPPQKMKNSNFLSWVQIWAYPEYTPPPWKWKTLTFLTFFREFKSELTQNPPPPRKWKNLTFFPEFKSELTQNTPHSSWSMWRLYPLRIQSSFLCTWSCPFPTSLVYSGKQTEPCIFSLIDTILHLQRTLFHVSQFLSEVVFSPKQLSCLLAWEF